MCNHGSIAPAKSAVEVGVIVQCYRRSALGMPVAWLTATVAR